jgi:carboxymethylenebutenolidase
MIQTCTGGRKMKSPLLLAFAFLLVTTGLLGQALPAGEAGALEQIGKSPRHSEWVTVDAGGGDKVNLWVVYPERKDKASVVLVVHEIFGLNDWARGVADSLAAAGFIAVAPDFLSGKGPDGKGSAAMTVDQARALNSALSPDEVFRRLDVAAKYATALPAARHEYGVVGFCWGGAISFGYATRQPALKASVVYYGTSPAKEALASIKAPVLGLYGGNDARVNATVSPAVEEMKKLGKRYETETYDGAGHGFLRQLEGQAGANLKAAQSAWPRTVAFLKQQLEGTKASHPHSHNPQPVLAQLHGAADCGPEDCGSGAPLPKLARKQ